MSLINYTTNIFIQVEYCFSLTLNLEVAYDPEKIALSTKTTLDGSVPASEDKSTVRILDDGGYRKNMKVGI